VSRIQGIVVALLPALLCCAAFGGDGSDYHVNKDPAARLFRLSPFAHGYIHGYEAGFAMGDDDVQMGRGDQHIEKTGEFRDADREYQRAFGDRENFRAGYREGLVVGYHDALTGGEFRALNELRRLATGLESDLVVSSADAGYDGGFLAGYRAARQDHANDCSGAPASASKEHFCSGFLDGYELGDSDSGAIATAQEHAPPPPVAPGNRRAPKR
jgi:hypothetical protein